MNKTTPIHLLDGPLMGTTVSYYTPLPVVLVVATKEPIRYHDYIRAWPRHYRHSATCPACTTPRPVDLDCRSAVL